MEPEAVFYASPRPVSDQLLPSCPQIPINFHNSTDLSTFWGAFRGVRRESGLLTGFFGKGKLREGVLIMQENKQHTT